MSSALLLPVTSLLVGMYLGWGVPLSAALTSEGKLELGEGRKGSLLQAIVYLTSKTNYVILGNYA